MSEVTTPSPQATPWLLRLSLTFNVLALALAIVLALPRESYTADRFEVLGSDGKPHAWFAATQDGAELVFLRSYDGAGMRYVVDAQSARFEAFDASQHVLAQFVATLDMASIRIDSLDKSSVYIGAEASGSRLSLEGPEGSILIADTSEGQTIRLKGQDNEGHDSMVELTASDTQSLLRTTLGDNVTELGTDTERSWITNVNGEYGSRTRLSASDAGAEIALSQNARLPSADAKVDPQPTHTLVLEVDREHGQFRLDTPTRTVRWPEPEAQATP